jgi:hypothetical protein
MEPTVTTGLGPEGSRMPFTPSHAAAVLPLVRTPLPASALVVGSVAPDLPYYLPWTAGLVTHTALAVVSTDLVLGALIWVVWHAVLAAPAVAVAPSWLRARLAGVPLGLRGRVSSPSAVGRVALALVAGSATHVLWDEFTHARRWGAEHVPVLAAVYGPLPGWAWAQQAACSGRSCCWPGSCGGGAVRPCTATVVRSRGGRGSWWSARGRSSVGRRRSRPRGPVRRRSRAPPGAGSAPE